MKLQNPFTNEEELKNWFELDPSYNHLMQSKYSQNFKNNSNPFIMSIQNTITYFTKHAVVASLLLFISLGSIGAVAAELTLPEEYKPSTVVKNLFAANTQPDTDPYTRLVYDGDNDVVSLDRCNLAVKYPKKVGEANAFSSSIETTKEDMQWLNYLGIMEISADPIIDSSLLKYQTTYPANIYCFDKNGFDKSKYLEQLNVVPRLEFSSIYSDLKFVETLNNSPYQERQKYEDEIKANVKTESWTKQQLQEKFGWFITESGITDISVSYNAYQLNRFDDTFEDSIYGKIIDRKFLDQKVEYGAFDVFFTYNDFVYHIEFIQNPPEKDTYSISGKDIQMQFNSLVKNEFSQIAKPRISSTSEPKNKSKLSRAITNQSCVLGEITSYTDENANMYVNNIILAQASIDKADTEYKEWLGFSDLEKDLQRQLFNGFEKELFTKSQFDKIINIECTIMDYSISDIVIKDLGIVDYQGLEFARAYLVSPESIGGGSSYAGDSYGIKVAALNGDDIILLSQYIPKKDLVTDFAILKCYDREEYTVEGQTYVAYQPKRTEGQSIEDNSVISAAKCLSEQIDNQYLQSKTSVIIADLTQTFALQE
jgi:hypothetical protein